MDTLFGFLPEKLQDDDFAETKKFRDFFKGGRSGSRTDRLEVSLANLLGYLLRFGLLAGGQQKISEDFFGNRVQINNINKGRNNNASQDFKNLEPLLDKYRMIIIR